MRTSPTPARSWPCSPGIPPSGSPTSTSWRSPTPDPVRRAGSEPDDVCGLVSRGQVAGVEELLAVPYDLLGVIGRVVGVHDHEIGGSELLGAQLALDRHRG